MKKGLIFINIVLGLLLLSTYYFEDKIEIYFTKARFDNVVISSSPVNINDNLYVKHEYIAKYDNEYEKLIQDYSDEDYRIIDIEVAGNKGWLVVVYDPSMVRIMNCKGFKTPKNDGKETIVDMTKRYGAIVGVNGGAFYDDGKVSKDIPFGYIIEDGKLIYKSHSRKSELIGISNDNKLTLITTTGEEAIEMGIRDALEFGPFLIVNGKRQEITKVTRASRNVIAQREDGIFIFLITEGVGASGITLSEATDYLENFKVYNAANLDGGASTQLVENGVMLNKPKNAYGIPIQKGRTVVNGFGIFEK